MKEKVTIFANGVFETTLSGGDVHVFNIAKHVGTHFDITFVGGPNLALHLRREHIPAQFVNAGGAVNLSKRTFIGQIALFLCLILRCIRSSIIALTSNTDIAYASSDHWFDAIPLCFIRARLKLMICHMIPPTFWQILKRGRPDVRAGRLNALHFWLSWHLSHFLFGHLKHKKLLYIHPGMAERLDGIHVSQGIDVEAIESTPAQPKIFDLIWIGRLDAKDEVEDAIFILCELKRRIEGFKAILVGDLKQLVPRLHRCGLADCITFVGCVGNAERFRLLKSSRIFLLSSHFENWSTLVAEAIVSRIITVAYDLPAFGLLYGDLIQVAPRFDIQSIFAMAEEEINCCRATENIPWDKFYENLTADFAQRVSFKSIAMTMEKELFAPALCLTDQQFTLEAA